jgi:hypothetical protein
MKEVVENNAERLLYAPLGEVNHYCVLYAAEKLLLYVSCRPIDYSELFGSTDSNANDLLQTLPAEMQTN